MIVDAKSGMTGAGKTLRESSHAGSVLENFSPYAVGAHRHAPEIAQVLGFARLLRPAPAAGAPRAARDLLPAHRAPTRARCSRRRTPEARSCAVLPEGVEPEIGRVQGTDGAEIGVFADRATGTTIVICAIDNLGKGAAGQAVQNANLALGLAETAGPAARGRARVSVTAARGFVASGVAAGIRRRDRKDLAIVRSLPAAVGGRDVHAQPRPGRLPAGRRASTSRSPTRRRW